MALVEWGGGRSITLIWKFGWAALASSMPTSHASFETPEARRVTSTISESLPRMGSRRPMNLAAPASRNHQTSRKDCDDRAEDANPGGAWRHTYV